MWRILLDVKVLDAAGNTIDTVFIATLAALMAFKRPEASVEVSEDGLKSAVTLHSTAEREAIPLSLHQAPLAVTFAVFLVSSVACTWNQGFGSFALLAGVAVQVLT